MCAAEVLFKKSLQSLWTHCGCHLTQSSGHLAALSALRIVDVPIMAARNKDVRRKRVLLGFHCRKFGLNIPYRRSESLQRILKACRAFAKSVANEELLYR
jgi:hypothetical protein